MKLCPLCHAWQHNELTLCPDCGVELERNEASSEDADDGKFEEVTDE